MNIYIHARPRKRLVRNAARCAPHDLGPCHRRVLAADDSDDTGERPAQANSEQSVRALWDQDTFQVPPCSSDELIARDLGKLDKLSVWVKGEVKHAGLKHTRARVR